MELRFRSRAEVAAFLRRAGAGGARPGPGTAMAARLDADPESPAAVLGGVGRKERDVGAQRFGSRRLPSADREAAARDRHQRAAHRPGLRLLAGRKGQLRRRPGGRRGALAANPDMARRRRANRAFLGRAVRYLVAEAGIRQFLDIGTGIPTAATPTRSPRRRARVPGRLRGQRPDRAGPRPGAADQRRPAGATAYIDADLRDPATILAAGGRHAGPHPAGGGHADRRSCTASRTTDDPSRSWRRCWRDAVRQLPGDLAPDQRHQPGEWRRPRPGGDHADEAGSAPGGGPALLRRLGVLDPGLVPGRDGGPTDRSTTPRPSGPAWPASTDPPAANQRFTGFEISAEVRAESVTDKSHGSPLWARLCCRARHRRDGRDGAGRIR